jgi:hypothetical protein
MEINLDLNHVSSFKRYHNLFSLHNHDLKLSKMTDIFVEFLNMENKKESYDLYIDNDDIYILN